MFWVEMVDGENTGPFAAYEVQQNGTLLLWTGVDIQQVVAWGQWRRVYRKV
jgi:hypothetical protein